MQTLRNEIEKILAPYIEKKRKQIEIKPDIPTPEKINKLNEDVCSLLNKLAKKHMSEPPPDNIIIDGEETKIKELTVKPPYANIEISKERYFSVYAPNDILNLAVERHQIKISSNNKHIQVFDPGINLNPHPKYSNIYYGRFRIIGRIDGEEATITCKLGEHTATADVKVAPPGKIGPRKDKPKGGFFQGIKPDPEPNPSQRVRYDENSRIIWVFVNFSGVKKYFEDNLNFKSAESKVMYAELIGEAFCRFTARYDVDNGKPPVMGGDQIGAFSTAMNNSQKEYLHLIHEAVFEHKL